MSNDLCENAKSQSSNLSRLLKVGLVLIILTIIFQRIVLYPREAREHWRTIPRILVLISGERIEIKRFYDNMDGNKYGYFRKDGDDLEEIPKSKVREVIELKEP
jgi:hypothetical protein